MSSIELKISHAMDVSIHKEITRMECLDTTQLLYTESFKDNLYNNNIEAALFDYMSINDPSIYDINAIELGLKQWQKHRDPHFFRYFSVMKSLGAPVNSYTLVNIDKFYEIFPIIYQEICFSTTVSYEALVDNSSINGMIMNDKDKFLYTPTLIDLLLIKGRSDLAYRIIANHIRPKEGEDRWFTTTNNNSLYFIYHLLMSQRLLFTSEYDNLIKVIDYLSSIYKIELSDEDYKKVIYSFTYQTLCVEEIDEKKLNLLSYIQDMDQNTILKDVEEAEKNIQISI